MTQVSANINTSLDAAPVARRAKSEHGKGDGSGGFAELVRDAGAGLRKANPNTGAEKVGQAHQPDGKGANAKNADATDEIPRRTVQGEGNRTPLEPDGTADNVAPNENATDGSRQDIAVLHTAESSSVGRSGGSDAGTRKSERTTDTDAAKQSATDEKAKPAQETEAAQPAAAGPAPVVAVMAVAPYLTARTASADAAAKPGAAQRSAVQPEGAASGESIDVPAARGQAASSKAEAIDIAFGSAATGRDGAGQPGNSPAGGQQQVANRSGTPQIDGPAIPLAGSAAPPAGGEARPPQPVVVPLDLGRALAGEGDLPASMREAVSSHVARVMAAPVAGQPVSVLRIQLQPAHLGQINVTMRMSGEQVTVTLTPDSASAARALGSDQETIATVLRAVGGTFAGANIEVAGEGQPRAGSDDAASHSFEGGRGDPSGEDGRGLSSGGASGSAADGAEQGRAGDHTGAGTSSGEGRIII
ncbi:MAG: flagellar hook-length control protein FliK [Roseitalea sp.]|nr:flagellar hook-length control protein FliK [Roseitalea sp.]MBO6741378.1 flagellar hook-length control protein FliK [Roseitalea sp.]